MRGVAKFGAFLHDQIGRKKVYRVREDLDFDGLTSMLKTPKVGEVYLKSDDLNLLKSKSLSSLSALSHYANIVSIEKTYAIDKRYFEEQISRDEKIPLYEEQYDSDLVKIELWNYPPKSIQKNIIDPISLYILLKDEVNSEETRLVEALQELKAKIEGMIIDTRYREV